ncbi:MAG: hypothetical protein R3E64_06140 [Halioglobus sp.]
MKVYLHIGFPKTGSTAVQSHIFTNQQWFLNHGYYIPQAGYASGFGHAFLLGADDYSFSANDTVFSELSQQGALADLAQELRSAELQGFCKALISWEGFALSNKNVIDRLKQTLQGHHVILIVYIRDQPTLYQSAILQNIENLIALSKATIFETNDVPDSEVNNYNFYRVLSTWKSIFADQIEIRVRVYDKNKLLEKNIVRDFLQFIGLGAIDGFSLQSKRINTSIDARSAALLLVAKAAGLDYKGLLALSTALVRVADMSKRGQRRFLTKQAQEDLRRRFRKSNQQLVQEFPPENIGTTDTLFSSTDFEQPAEASESELDFFRHVYHALREPVVGLWQGQSLTSQRLARVAGPPNKGWRGPELSGVWSVGPESEIAFRLPQTDSVGGPKSIILTIAGRYFGDNTTTAIVINDKEEQTCLTRKEIRIVMDDHIRENGVHIYLRHATPQVLENGKPVCSKSGLAFKLEFLSYKFNWEK